MLYTKREFGEKMTMYSQLQNWNGYNDKESSQTMGSGIRAQACTSVMVILDKQAFFIH